MEKLSSIFKEFFETVQQGEDTIGESSIKELTDSLKNCVKFEEEKYSLESYLEIVGKYTDQVIIEAAAKQMRYLGGECKVIKDCDDDMLVFSLEMYFENRTGSKMKKTATRKIPADKFTDDTIRFLGKEEKCFEIEKPGEK